MPSVKQEVVKCTSNNCDAGPKKRKFKLYENTSGPRNGGIYTGTPAGAAKKCANRWLVPKNSFEKVVEFKMIEIKRTGDKKIYEFKVKRVKLATPKRYMRNDVEVVVDSKIVLV